jgi:drug/metabolite transporter (DMT)-like permease
MSNASSYKITPLVGLLLVIPPLLWAGNAVVGRIVLPLIPPITLNLFRWLVAFLLLVPVAWPVLRANSPLWPAWRRFAFLGLLGTGGYNTLQYVALQTSSPLNVTLVAASTPIWMLILGRLFFGVPIPLRSVVGALCSIAGVVAVISHGQWERLRHVQLVAGDAWMLLAALVWAWYSWLLARPKEPASIRQDWSAFLLGQMVFGLAWSGLFAGGEWWSIAQTTALPAETAVAAAHEGRTAVTHITWGWPLLLALLYVAVGPSLLAYRCWGAGVQRVGPTIAGFFNNLTPLFAALLSTLFLGQSPQPYHLVAFVLIVGGILISSVHR